MAGYKETPRQKMIGMMYLVLTALLALNVSKEILEAFLIVNDSMETTNENFREKIDGTYGKFEHQYQLNPGKVKDHWTKAQEAQRLSNDMIGFIELVKAEAISDCEGRKVNVEQARTIKLRKVKSKDKYDQATNYFIGDSQDGSKGKSSELRKKIDKYKNDMVELTEGAISNIGFDTEGPFFNAEGKKAKNWEMHHFYHTILAADITILNKLIAEVNNAEFDVVSHLYSQVSAEDYTFDQVEARVIPKSNYVLTGQEYEAEIFVAALDTKSDINGEIIVSGTTKIIEGDSGKLNYITNVGSSTGIKEFSGFIIVKKKGRDIKYPFKSSYIVAQPSANVSADKMNVFYIGVDNPVTVSVPGVADELVRANITFGSISKTAGKGKYVVRVSKGANKTKVNVSAQFEEGSKSMGSAEFRVKRVPDPIAKCAGTNSGRKAKGEVLASGAIIPSMPDGFDFQLTFKITSFNFSTMFQGDIIDVPCRGNRFSQRVIDLIKGARRGQKIYFENIMARGPDGNRKLGTIIIKLR